METFLWTVCWTGVVLCPILFGMFMKNIEKNWFVFWDVYVPLAVLSLLWPLLLITLLVVGVVALMCFTSTCAWVYLSKLGRLIGRKLGIDDDDELENDDE